MEIYETEFYKAFQSSPPDLDKAKTLLDEGFDINISDSFGYSVLDKILLDNSGHLPQCDDCEEDNCLTCEHKLTAKLIPIIDFFIENGWNTAAYGLKSVATLVHTTHDKQMFYAAKRILECPLSENAEEYGEALDAIGSEESFQRCCEECHEQENLYYAMYELVDAKRLGKPFDGIHTYHNALGKRIDKVIYFADKNDFNYTPRGTEFNGDFGFVFKNEVLIVTSDINILFMNDRISEEPQIDVSECFGASVIGATVVDITFSHKAKNRAEKCFGQPTVTLKLDNGKSVSFTHNFGELSDCRAQARFLTAESGIAIARRRDSLFDLCDGTDIDTDKIESFIVDAGLSSEDITRTAIRLVEKYEFEIDTFIRENGRRPEADELVTSGWLTLFKLFTEYGLDFGAVYRDDGHIRNILYNLQFLDNTEIMYKLYRLMFRNGADPNIRIGDESFFEDIDGCVVMNATLFDIDGEDRLIYEKEFRLWLLMLANGGILKNADNAIKMKDGYDLEIFNNCESFSYRKEKTSDDWFLHIYITKTGDEVAIL